jgi:hypothetical protein
MQRTCCHYSWTSCPNWTGSCSAKCRSLCSFSCVKWTPKEPRFLGPCSPGCVFCDRRMKVLSWEGQRLFRSSERPNRRHWTLVPKLPTSCFRRPRSVSVALCLLCRGKQLAHALASRLAVRPKCPFGMSDMNVMAVGLLQKQNGEPIPWMHQNWSS